MNPIIISSIPDKGVINFYLGTKVTGYIGLVDICLPQLEITTKLITVSCDQIDSTSFNRRRLLRSFYHRNKSAYTSTDFQHIMYYKLDSSDYKLTIKLSDETGPIQTTETVLLTLNVQPDLPKRWINM